MCSSIPTMPLFRHKAEPVEQVCGGCKLKETKPGAQPRDLTNAISTGLELDALKECGALFIYPDSLTPYQWVCLRALSAGRGIFMDKDMRKRMQDTKGKSEQARLEQRLKQ